MLLMLNRKTESHYEMESVLFKSELMTKCRFFIPPEAAYKCIAELGELGNKDAAVIICKMLLFRMCPVH